MSASILRKHFYPFHQYNSDVTVKFDASFPKLIHFQIEIQRVFLGINKPGTLQIAGDYNPKLDEFKLLSNCVQRMRMEGVVNKILSTPNFSDSTIHEDFAAEEEFGRCLHFSFVEREFQERSFERFKQRQHREIYTLRAFWGALSGHGNWNYPVFASRKPTGLCNIPEIKRRSLCEKFSLTNAESRLIYILHHLSVDYALFSF